MAPKDDATMTVETGAAQGGKTPGRSIPAPSGASHSTWETRLIAAGGSDIPLYRSDEYEALPDGDPRKVASVVRAAEAFRSYFSADEIARRLRIELDVCEFAARWPSWIVDRVVDAAGRPNYAALCDRRGEPERAARAREHEQRLADAIIVLGDGEGDPIVDRDYAPRPTS